MRLGRDSFFILRVRIFCGWDEQREKSGRLRDLEIKTQVHGDQSQKIGMWVKIQIILTYLAISQ